MLVKVGMHRSRSVALQVLSLPHAQNGRQILKLLVSLQYLSAILSATASEDEIVLNFSTLTSAPSPESSSCHIPIPVCQKARRYWAPPGAYNGVQLSPRLRVIGDGVLVRLSPATSHQVGGSM